ncbi:MAG: hypothetical protein M3H12_02125 [Chromatiales bacterium]|nr:hypothetical protein [Gammaproteobacteria bacterium]
MCSIKLGLPDPLRLIVPTLRAAADFHFGLDLDGSEDQIAFVRPDKCCEYDFFG